jgi:preprotein translocase subunit SecB
MAEPTDNGSSNPGPPPAGPAGPPLQVRVVGQYIKDLSFENPNIRKLIDGPGEQPALRVEVNVNAAKMADKVFESAIIFKAEANSKAGVIYDLELTYAGLFEIQSIPEQALEPFLLINCPALLFPFLRRLVADLTREGGFPPLLLDPIDFAGLFMQRQQQGAAQGVKPVVN